MLREACGEAGTESVGATADLKAGTVMSKWPGHAEGERTSFGGLLRGRLMARVRSTGNKTTERRLASLLREEGLSGWRRHQPLPGKPDFSWGPAKVVVFVDGCFWHGHDCGKNLAPKTNTKAWREKIQRNQARDRRASRQLRYLGWAVIRIWECQLAKDPDKCVRRIKRAIEISTR